MPRKTNGTSSAAKPTNGKTTKPKTTKPRARKAATPERTEEAIRIRAYELFLARDGAGGSEMEDWLQAEREVGTPSSRGATRRKAAQEISQAVE